MLKRAQSPKQPFKQRVFQLKIDASIKLNELMKKAQKLFRPLFMRIARLFKYPECELCLFVCICTLHSAPLALLTCSCSTELSLCGYL